MNKLENILLGSIKGFQAVVVKSGVYVFDGNDEQFLYSRRGTKKLFKQAEKLGFRLVSKTSPDGESEGFDFKR